MLEQGQFKPRLSEFNCEDAINELVASLKPHFVNKNNTFKAKFSQNLPDMIKSDKSRMLQVLLNLLSNANKFT